MNDHKLTQKEIKLLSNTLHNGTVPQINIPINFSTFEQQFDKLIFEKVKEENYENISERQT